MARTLSPDQRGRSIFWQRLSPGGRRKILFRMEQAQVLRDVKKAARAADARKKRAARLPWSVSRVVAKSGKVLEQTRHRKFDLAETSFQELLGRMQPGEYVEIRRPGSERQAGYRVRQDSLFA